MHVETAGSGPALLLVHGGNGDCDIFGGLVAALADRYRVTMWVRRGFVRSPVDAVPDDRLAADVADAVALIGDGEPAHVFGSSSGAVVAVELLARHPDRVATVVAHEPPLLGFLPDAGTWRARHEELYRRFLAEGVGPAFAAFIDALGMAGADRLPPADELPPPIRAMMERAPRNQAFWFEHELRQYPDHLPDVDALRAAGPRLVVGAGRESRESMPGRCAAGLAASVDRPVAEFPGGHGGYGQHPAEFAATLDGAITPDR